MCMSRMYNCLDVDDGKLVNFLQVVFDVKPGHFRRDVEIDNVWRHPYKVFMLHNFHPKIGKKDSQLRISSLKHGIYTSRHIEPVDWGGRVDKGTPSCTKFP